MISGVGRKFGIGSRGGQQIGVTRQGRPIYESSHHRYDKLHEHRRNDIGQDANAIAGHFRTYTKQDHEDAASAHFKEAYKRDFGHKESSPIGRAHLRASLAHNRLANAAQKAMPKTFTLMKSRSAAPQRFGQTRSGKVVYADKSVKSPCYADFSDEEHDDAQRVHANAVGSVSRTTKQRLRHAHLALAHRMASEEIKNESLKTTSTEKSMQSSADLFKSFLSKSQFKSGNIDNAETVDLDADMTGASSKGKSTSAPGGFDDQEEEENKKVKKKVDKNATNGGPGKSVASQVGFEESDAGKVDKLQDCGPYDFGGDVTDDIGNAPTGPLVDGYILRSEQIAEMMKGGEGSRGGMVSGHTKSGKPIYAAGHSANAKMLTSDRENGQGRVNIGNKLHAAINAHGNYKAQDHQDAAEFHEKQSKKSGDVHDHLAEGHQLAAGYLSASTRKSLTPQSSAYVAADSKSYQQRIEQRGFVQHATGGMDNYLAQMSKGDSFYANGTNYHNPQDQNHVAQTLCKSCDQQHSSIYGVCPHCGPAVPFGKSMSQSQSHAGYGLIGHEQGSALVDMSGFSLVN